VLGVAHAFAGAVVEERLFAEAHELEYVLLVDRQDVAAVVDDGSRVTLLALQFDGHLQVLLLAVEIVFDFEAFVGLCLDDLNEGVVVDVAAEEHFLQLVVDAKGVEHLLAQVEVLFHADGKFTLLVVGACDFHFLELHGLLESKRGQVRPDLLVLQWLTHLFFPRELLTRGYIFHFLSLHYLINEIILNYKLITSRYIIIINYFKFYYYLFYIRSFLFLLHFKMSNDLPSVN